MKRRSQIALVVAVLTAAALGARVDAAPQAAAPPVAAPSAAAPSGASTGAFGFGGDDSGKPIHIEADDGVEWQQTNRVYIARGNAKATRGETTVTADTLYAYYRPPQPATAAPAAGSAPAAAKPATDVDGSTQIYRMEADGHVVFSTPTQNAYGDHAVYDVDQALLVMTGKNLKIVTPQDIVTARDSLEWYDQKQLGVARGDALAVRQGPVEKSMRGDVLIAEVSKPANQPSKISKIDGQGHVVLVSQDEIALGDSAVYNLDTGIATLNGNVSLTKGDNELRGQYGVVDTNRNVARLLPAPQQRVQGLIVPPPRDQSGVGKPESGDAKPQAGAQKP